MTTRELRLALAAGAAGAAAGAALGYLAGQRRARGEPDDQLGHALAEVPPEERAVARLPARRELSEVLPLIMQIPRRNLVRSGSEQVAAASARAVFAVTSGKGGVGKSTVSVNLAYALRDLGLTVGILDLDIYGPSLPELLPMPPNSLAGTEDGKIIPFGYAGVGLMSWGYVQPGQATTIRAPVANRCTTQLLTMVQWGELDVLVVDTPPGTGDILMTLTQTLQIDGAVLVTTGNEMSVADLLKGAELLQKVDVPTLAVCHNMSRLACERCGHESDMFADFAAGQLRGLLEAHPPAELHNIPLDRSLSVAPRAPLPPQLNAYPYIRSADSHGRPAAAALRGLAESLLAAFLVGRSAAQQRGRSELRVRAGGALELRLGGGELRQVPCAALRAVDEMTGEVKHDQAKALEDPALRAVSVEAVGNYAARIEFSDGHTCLRSLRTAELLAGVADSGAAGHPRPEAW